MSDPQAHEPPDVKPEIDTGPGSDAPDTGHDVETSPPSPPTGPQNDAQASSDEPGGSPDDDVGGESDAPDEPGLEGASKPDPRQPGAQIDPQAARRALDDWKRERAAMAQRMFTQIESQCGVTFKAFAQINDEGKIVAGIRIVVND